MPTYSRTLRLNDGIISVERVNLSQFSLVAAYQYVSQGSSPKVLNDTDRLQKPDGTPINDNATFLEATVDNRTNPPTFTQIALDTSSAFDGSVALTIHDYDTFFPFTYPGVAGTEAYTEVAGSYLEGNIALNLKGPVQTEVQATVFEILQSSSVLTASDYNFSGARGLWAPNQWASCEVFGRSVSNAINVTRPITHLETVDLRGYRLDEGFGSELSGSNYDVVRFNNNTAIRQYDAFNTLSVTPLNVGPEDPVGNQYVLDIELEPFVSLDDGTTIYKKTIVLSDTIPAQVGLGYE
jgi:hypothetical protein